MLSLALRRSLFAARRPVGVRAFASKEMNVDFDWQDAFNLEGRLTEDEIMIRDMARKFADEKLMPRVLEGFRNEVFDRKIMKEMGGTAWSVCDRNRGAARAVGQDVC